MGKAPAFQFYPKQYVADNNVQAMEWDARGMYVHLLCMAWQETPPGSIPNDDATIRRWLNLSRDTEENLRTWRRVRPQIMAAWTLRDGRWHQTGLCETWVRMEKRSQASTNNVRKRYEPHEVEEEVLKETQITKPRFNFPALGEVIAYCHERGNLVDPQQWFNYYTSNGWKVGRNPMKDWRAAVRTWEKNGYGTNGKPAQEAKPEKPDLSGEADPECRRCYGGGYAHEEGNLIPCVCTLRPVAARTDRRPRGSEAMGDAGSAQPGFAEFEEESGGKLGSSTHQRGKAAMV